MKTWLVLVAVLVTTAAVAEPDYLQQFYELLYPPKPQASPQAPIPYPPPRPAAKPEIAPTPTPESPRVEPRSVERQKPKPKLPVRPKVVIDEGPDLPYSCSTVCWAASIWSQSNLEAQGRARGYGPKARRQAQACLRQCGK